MEVKEVVLEVLSNNESARNNDTLLIAEVWKYFGIPTDLVKAANIAKPSCETITRWRRKILESHPELKPTEKVERWREEQVEVHKKIAREG